MTDPTPSPDPVATLEYSYPTTQHGRPGIITAIGVMSIIVACLSGLASLWGAFSGVSYYMMSRMPPAVFTPPPTPGPATAPAGPTATATTTTTTTTSLVHSQSVSVVIGPGGTTTTTTTPGGAAAMGNPFAHISPVAAILSIVANLLSLALAIFLLVAGIQTLRDSPRGAKLHWWYAWLKIPLVILATATGLWLSYGMMSGMMAIMPTGPGAAPPPPQMGFMWGYMLIWAIIPACLALAYPIALLFVLRSRSVRDFYNTFRE